MADEKKEMTVQEARRVLQMRTASVYSLLRDEILQGRKNATDEWTIDVDSVEQYRLRADAIITLLLQSFLDH